MSIIAGLLEGLSLVQSVLLLIVTVLVVFAPVACWSCLGRLIRIEREVLNELKILNSMLRNKGMNMG